MESKTSISLPLAFLFVLLLSYKTGGTLMTVSTNAEKTWCVAKPSSNDEELKANIMYACQMIGDCTIIKPGSPCFQSASLISMASVVMNEYYRSAGGNIWNCDFHNSGLITITNPSYVLGLMLGEFVDEYTVRVVDVFAMPQRGTGVNLEAVDHVFQTNMLDMLKQTGRNSMQKNCIRIWGAYGPPPVLKLKTSKWWVLNTGHRLISQQRYPT